MTDLLMQYISQVACLQEVADSPVRPLHRILMTLTRRQVILRPYSPVLKTAKMYVMKALDPELLINTERFLQIDWCRGGVVIALPSCLYQRQIKLPGPTNQYYLIARRNL